MSYVRINGAELCLRPSNGRLVPMFTPLSDNVVVVVVIIAALDCVVTAAVAPAGDDESVLPPIVI